MKFTFIQKNGLNACCRMKNRMFIALLVLLFCAMLIFTSASAETNPQHSVSAISIEYMEDASGTMTLEQVQAKALSGSFLPHAGYSLKFGKSRSTWWLRIKLEDVKAKNRAEYLSIYNPTVAKAVLYLPVNGKDGIKYTEFRSGWYYKGDTQDEGFLYPVFRLAGNADHGSYAYIMLQSPFTQNYDIRFLSGGQFNEIKLKTLLFLGLFLGVLLAMAIYNLIIFIGLRDKAHLYYVVYILSMVVYQLALLGVSRVFLPRFAELFVANVITLGLVMIAAAIVFFRSFFDTRKNFPGHDRLLKLFLLLSAFGVLLMLAGRRYEANIYSHYFAPAVTGAILWVAILALKKGFQQAEFFLAGWSLLLISLVITIFRYRIRAVATGGA